MRVTGWAGPREFVAAGVPWPDEFARCMALVSCLEGTGFGDCNTTDIDGAGITLGIAGFTSAHGEVQELLGALVRRRPQVLQDLPQDLGAQLARLENADVRDRGPWERWFYGLDGRVKAAVREALRQWGTLPEMRRLQMGMARERFWEPAVVCAGRLGLTTPAARGLLLDVWVQNGGWGKRHEARLPGMDLKGAEESAGLERMALAVADCARPRWREDVAQRKLLFARGRGAVHGQEYCLVAQGILVKRATV